MINYGQRLRLKFRAMDCEDTHALLDAHDYWKARATVTEDDLPETLTAEQVRAYALANGWVLAPQQPSETVTLTHPQGYGPPICVWDTSACPSGHANLHDTLRFCEQHAKLSGMSQFDVLEAIGAMP